MSAERSWTILELLRWTTQHFETKGIESARLDAECLLAYALGTDRMRLYIDFEKPVAPAERARFRELVKGRAGDRVPVSHLVGAREFWSLPFKVSPDVLAPRPETETLVQAALDRLPEPEQEYHVLDLGTGSGAIALAIASERPKARVIASDISPLALKIARENAEELQLSEHVRFLEADLFCGLESERFDLVVSNPPYLARSEAALLAPELRHEPDVALFAGEDGLAVLGPLLAQVAERLVSGGAVVVEIDPRQSGVVAGWCREAGLERIAELRDLSGKTRAIAAHRCWPASGGE